jgi:hypothetical protein
MTPMRPHPYFTHALTGPLPLHLRRSTSQEHMAQNTGNISGPRSRNTFLADA